MAIRGEINGAISEGVKPGRFNLCTYDGEQYYILFSGNDQILAVQFLAAGIVESITRNGQDIYWIMNPEDYEKFRGIMDGDGEDDDDDDPDWEVQ